MFWNGVGALTLGLLGEIKWLWLPALLIGSVLGGYIGAHMAIVKGSRAIKRVFEIITLLVGAKQMTSYIIWSYRCHLCPGGYLCPGG